MLAIVRGLQNTALALVLAFLATVASVGVVLFQDDLSVVFSSWADGKPKMMVKLEIPVPGVGADFCYVAVMRFPGRLRPTKANELEMVHSGRHGPGETVVVRELHRAIVAEESYDPRTGEYGVEYYEPVEYLAMVLCVGGGGTEYKYGRVHQVFPRSLVWTHRVEVELVEEKSGRKAESPSAGHVALVSSADGVTSITAPVSCDLGSVPSICSGEHVRRECFTYVKGPVLRSLEGLTTSFAIYGQADPRPSVVYLEAYYDIVPALAPDLCRREPEWKSAGKKEVVALADSEAYPLSGNMRDRVYLGVTFVYTQGCYSDPFTGGFCWWSIHPTDVSSVRRSEQLVADGTLPWYMLELASYDPHPPVVPSYVREAADYVKKIPFAPPRLTDNILADIGVAFTVTVEWKWVSFSLAISFYGAGRDDGYYTTPYVRVENPAWRTYRWWYKDDDPMTYELFFKWK